MLRGSCCLVSVAAIWLSGCDAYRAELLGEKGGSRDERVPDAGDARDGGALDGAASDGDASSEAQLDAGEPALGDGGGAATDAAMDAGGGDVADSDGGSEEGGPCDGSTCCPAGSLKAEPGQCGCDVLDDDQGGQAGCLGLRDALVHRYRFDGSGQTAVDSRSGLDGAVVHTSLDGSGALVLGGTLSDRYVDLPNGLVSALQDATFEAFLTWGDDDDRWQRVFDFGTSGSEGSRSSMAGPYLFLTTRSSGGAPRVAYTNQGYFQETVADGQAPLASGVLVQLAVVFDDGGDTLSLYIDGQLAGSSALDADQTLSAIDDVNNWLGRSQYTGDPSLDATLHEFRIYDRALSAEQLSLSHQQGPDPSWLP